MKVSLPVAGQEPDIPLYTGILEDDLQLMNAEIRLVGSGGKAHQIFVSEGMMNDIVKPLWGSLVVVKGVRVGGAIRLNDIQPAESGNGS